MLSLTAAAAAAGSNSSFSDRLVLWLHIAFVIFTIGPLTAAMMSTPRYIRAGNVTIVRYLHRTTRLFALISLGVLIFGIVAAQQRDDFAKPWLTVSMTLFVVALVLLVIVIRDQRKAARALESAAAAPAVAAAPPGTAVATTAAPAVPDTPSASDAPSATAASGAPAASPDTAAAVPATATDPAVAAPTRAPAVQPASAAAAGPAATADLASQARHIASVERGRITTIGAVVSVIWLVILVLMIWH